MAEPIGFPEVNTEWIGPGDVGPLHTLSGDGFMLSCWILTPEEIEHVQRTGQVWLTVWGDIHPPVNIQAEYPFGGVEDPPAITPDGPRLFMAPVGTSPPSILDRVSANWQEVLDSPITGEVEEEKGPLDPSVSTQSMEEI